ncbi:hypothetical protein WDJ51_01825 [Rathayibacter sp. YIM 133350]|uniref:hypothetical protein n=1 Tax=Rathayibacter sp. YIM 133350 TaxID=3131992 RepID=UPI00307D00D2
MSQVEENTLGVVVGRENLPRRTRQFRRPQRTVSTTRANQDALGGRHLQVGTVTGATLVSAFLFLLFVMELPNLTDPLLSLLAWGVLLVGCTATTFAVRSQGGSMPRWLFASALAAGVVVMALDLAGSWGKTEQYVVPTAALAVPVLLLALVTLRETVQIITAAAAIGLGLIVATLFEPRPDPLSLAPELMLIAVAVGAPLLGVAIVRSYRRMVQLELDLALVQSTVQAPRMAVGMLASEELTRLDDDAESLLDDVASGRLPLPLPAEAAARATALATALRLHLIEGRKETWVRHAVAESEFLAPAVTIDDPSSLAGLLGAAQRDALLLVIWLLVSDTDRWGATVHITFGPTHPPTVGNYRTVRFPIVLETTGVLRRRVDAAAWDAMGIVGPHVDSVYEGSLRVEIDCTVDALSEP